MASYRPMLCSLLMGLVPKEELSLVHSTVLHDQFPDLSFVATDQRAQVLILIWLQWGGDKREYVCLINLHA